MTPCSTEHLGLGQTNSHFSLLTFESANARIPVAGMHAWSEDSPFGPAQVSFLRLCLTCLQPQAVPMFTYIVGEDEKVSHKVDSIVFYLKFSSLSGSVPRPEKLLTRSFPLV